MNGGFIYATKKVFRRFPFDHWPGDRIYIGKVKVPGEGLRIEATTTMTGDGRRLRWKKGVLFARRG